jgi:hypothetical protein
LSASVTETSPLAWTASSQGVRQLCPDDVLASAPGGSDSIRSASDDGADFMKFRLDMDMEEHAARVKPHAMMAMTRLMIGSHHLGGKRRLVPNSQPYERGGTDAT